MKSLEIYDNNIEKYTEKYFNYLKEILDNVDKKSIKQFVEIILQARERGSSVFFIGNGGSAATASHFANDLSIGTNDYLKPFRVLSLTDNIPVVTAIANDFGYDEVFERQLSVLGKKDDVLIAISASGNSQNLINAIKYAKKNDIITFALTAFDGGEIKKISDYCIHIPTKNKEYGPAEDAHMILDHLVGSYLIGYLENN